MRARWKNYRRWNLLRLAKFLSVLLAFAVSACGVSSGDQTVTPVFHADGNPPLLSDWGVVSRSADNLVLGTNVVAYDLNTPLFSDYAHKLRTVWMPEGKSATYKETETFDFPVGTVISKTFYYPRGKNEGEVLKTDQGDMPPLDITKNRLIETRILAHRADGWVALPYVWNDDQSEATLKRTGDIKKLTFVSNEGAQEFPYVVPNVNQCAGCHATNATTKKLIPIGPKARHLNKPYGGEGDNQLNIWNSAGLLAGLPEAIKVSKAVDWTNLDASLNSRARAYLDINCAHCHNKVGPADTSGLHFEPETETGVHLGLCKLPIAAGNGTGDRPYDIVPGDPDNSITTYRMASTKPSEMMPELGRSLAHDEGVNLIHDWIKSLEGDCS